jgi:hypothetical protein
MFKGRLSNWLITNVGNFYDDSPQRGEVDSAKTMFKNLVKELDRWTKAQTKMVEK